MPNVQLTYDAWELITAILGDGLDPDRPSMLGLRNLALTCKAMVPLCRRHLFSTLDLTVPYWKKEKLPELIGRLHEVLLNPAIVQYVRRLNHDLYFPGDVRLHHIFDVLSRSTCLRFVHLWGAGKDWNTFPRPLQILLDRLVHLPTITSLKIFAMKSVPTSILLGSTHITHITTGGMGFTHNDDLEAGRVISTSPRPISFCARPDLNGLGFLLQPSERRKDDRIIDFSGLREAEFDMCDTVADIALVCEIVRISRALESLNVSVMAEPLSWTGLGASLSVLNVRTLRNLTLGSFVESEDYEPLSNLVHELELIAGINILEEVLLGVMFSTDVQCRADTGDWLAFDSLLTRPGSFPMLKVATVEISWGAWTGDETEILARITEKNFPNLLASTSLGFRFSSRVEWV